MNSDSDEAETVLPQKPERVAKEDKVTITRQGVPAATLVPVRRGGRLDVKTAVEELKKLRKGRTLGGLTIREMIEEGRRI